MSKKREELIEKIISKIKSSYEVCPDLVIKGDTNLMKLLDSLDFMNYLLYLEEEFGVKIDDEQDTVDYISFVSNAVDYILLKTK